MDRPFRTPFFPVVPVLGVLMCLFLLMSLMAVPATRNFFVIYLAVAIVVYFTYGLWHSKLGKSGVARFEAELATMGAHPPVE